MMVFGYLTVHDMGEGGIETCPNVGDLIFEWPPH